MSDDFDIGAKLEDFLFLQTNAENFICPVGFKYKSLADFILRKGRKFDGGQISVPLGLDQHCFSNSYHLAFERRNLIYVEGYTASLSPIEEKEGSPEEWFLFHHAWCADEAGNIYDPAGPEVQPYWGVPFNIDFVTETNFERGGLYGVILNRECGFPLLSGKRDVPPLYPHPQDGWPRAMALRWQAGLKNSIKNFLTKSLQ